MSSLLAVVPGLDGLECHGRSLPNAFHQAYRGGETKVRHPGTRAAARGGPPSVRGVRHAASAMPSAPGAGSRGVYTACARSSALPVRMVAALHGAEVPCSPLAPNALSLRAHASESPICLATPCHPARPHPRARARARTDPLALARSTIVAIRLPPPPPPLLLPRLWPRRVTTHARQQPQAHAVVHPPPQQPAGSGPGQAASLTAHPPSAAASPRVLAPPAQADHSAHVHPTAHPHSAAACPLAHAPPAQADQGAHVHSHSLDPPDGQAEGQFSDPEAAAIHSGAAPQQPKRVRPPAKPSVPPERVSVRQTKGQAPKTFKAEASVDANKANGPQRRGKMNGVWVTFQISSAHSHVLRARMGRTCKRGNEIELTATQ